MSYLQSVFLNSHQLSKQTSLLGLKLYVLILAAIIVATLFLLLLCFLFLCLSSRPQHHRHVLSPPPSLSSSRRPLKLLLHDSTPQFSKEIIDISAVSSSEEKQCCDLSLPPPPPPVVSTTTGSASGESSSGRPHGGAPEVLNLGWGHWYSLRELELATERFSDENVVGEGGYGIVYRGVLSDRTVVAVKNLLNNRGQAEREFKVEVEAIGRVRHKNLVKLLGYCVEGVHRMLVYEYVENGNLEQWLHGDVGEVSPLTWERRMNILIGTAKGLAYLHEGLEPKVVHRDVKSSNILLDRRWNAKVSDFGLAKLLCSERTYVTTRVMGTFGYVAPEYASTGMLNERSDIYSFGVLIMEIISGRSPVDYTRPPEEVNLVAWVKNMVGDRNSEQIVDPKMPDKPSSKALKRALLVAIRCVDPNGQERPSMGHIVHMLEAEDIMLREERKLGGGSAGYSS